MGERQTIWIDGISWITNLRQKFRPAPWSSPSSRKSFGINRNSLMANNKAKRMAGLVSFLNQVKNAFARWLARPRNGLVVMTGGCQHREKSSLWIGLFRNDRLITSVLKLLDGFVTAKVVKCLLLDHEWLTLRIEKWTKIPRCCYFAQ